MTWKKGTEIANYQVTGAPLGAGGMATVYPIKDDKGTELALKVLHPHLKRERKTKQRFKLEFSIAQKLKNPAFVKVVKQIEKPEFAFSMERVSGFSLQTLLNKGLMMTETEACALTLQLVSAMQEFHEEGLIHRDLKPDNIMLTPQGRVKIMDYGVTREIGSNMTQTGMAIGTPLYMAPEQIHNSKGANLRCDIYSIGIILYRSITRKDPQNIGARTELYDLLQSRMEKKTVRAHPQLKNAKLIEIIEKCLAPLPDNRYQNDIELAKDLKKLKLTTISQSPALLAKMLKNFNAGLNKKKNSKGNQKKKVDATIVSKSTKNMALHHKVAIFAGALVAIIVTLLITFDQELVLDKAFDIIKRLFS